MSGMVKAVTEVAGRVRNGVWWMTRILKRTVMRIRVEPRIGILIGNGLGQRRKFGGRIGETERGQTQSLMGDCKKASEEIIINKLQNKASSDSESSSTDPFAVIFAVFKVQEPNSQGKLDEVVMDVVEENKHMDALFFALKVRISVRHFHISSTPSNSGSSSTLSYS
ncbi:hypothetical protein L1987_01369 [Smallanthus sonchifolius]|uniref:Uncharacterized protein n=1 Tax=Smallanthus sonchifolius TaxID=185202 RepID=A0ACB9K4P2_9ASTR|nr:hypothetical protein L1987_01369 [Smallanthus sonchifolius]